MLELEIPPRAAVPAHDPPRAQPAPLAPVLARDHRARPRRDLDALVRAARARHDHRPVRDVDRPADAHPLLPGRRRLRGHPGRLRAQAARLLRRDADPHRASTRRCSTATRSSCSARRGSGSSRASGCSSSGSPGRCCAPPASPGTCARPIPYLAYGEVEFKIPVGTVGDGYDRYRVRMQEMRESVRIIEQCLDGLPEGPVDRRRPQGRAAAARRARRPRWRR